MGKQPRTRQRTCVKGSWDIRRAYGGTYQFPKDGKVPLTVLNSRHEKNGSPSLDGSSALESSFRDDVLGDGRNTVEVQPVGEGERSYRGMVPKRGQRLMMLRMLNRH